MNHVMLRLFHILKSKTQRSLTFMLRGKWRPFRVKVDVTQTNVLTEAVSQPGGEDSWVIWGPARSCWMDSCRLSPRDNIINASPGMSPETAWEERSWKWNLPVCRCRLRGNGASLQHGCNSTLAWINHADFSNYCSCGSLWKHRDALLVSVD